MCISKCALVLFYICKSDRDIFNYSKEEVFGLKKKVYCCTQTFKISCWRLKRSNRDRKALVEYFRKAELSFRIFSKTLLVIGGELVFYFS